MTDLTIFNDTIFSDKDAVNDFLLANSVSHAQVAKIFEQRGKSISSYPLTDATNEKDWLATHNFVHQQEFALLGLTNMPDLSDVDMSNPEQYADWQNKHSLIHLYLNQALGITT